MLPIKLKIKGLYSYKEEVEIDFAQLCEGQLFGIFGEVGSGKSSILEAISFALYGESDRLNTRDRRSYNMMNLASNELLIDFVFICGKNDRYRFLVEGRRNSKNFDDVGTLSRRAFRLSNEDWQPLENPDCVEIIGLTYENFRRTIIIPQGKFQEFIHLSETYRTRMLKDIFRLERFELSDKVRKLELVNNHKTDFLSGQLISLEEISADAIKISEAEQQRKKEKTEELSKELKKVSEEYAEQKEIKDLAERLQKVREAQRIHNLQEADMALRKQQVNDFESCSVHFKDMFEQEQQLKQQQEESSKNLKQVEDDLARLEQVNRQHKSDFEKLKKEHQDDVRLQKQLQDLDNLLEAKQVGEQIAGVAGELRSAQEKAEIAADQLGRARMDLASLKKNFTKKREEALDVRALGEVKNWFSEKKHFEQHRKNIEQKIAEGAVEIAALADKKVQIIKPIAASFEDGLASLKVNKIRERLEFFIKEKDMLVEKLVQDQLKWQTRQELENFAEALTEGEACPLCGAGHHPQKLEKGDAERHVQQITKEVQRLRNMRSEAEKALRELDVLIESYRSLSKVKDELQQEKVEAEQQIDRHAQRFPSQQYKGILEKELERLRAQSKEQEQEMKALETQISSAEKNFTKLEAAEKNFTKELRDLQANEQKLQARQEALLKSLKVLDAQKYAIVHVAQLQEEILEVQKIMKSYHELEENLHQQKTRIEVLKAQGESAKKELHGLRHLHKEVMGRIEERLKGSRFQNSGEIAAILEKHKNMDLAKEKQQVEAWFEEQKRLNFAVEEIIKQLQGKDWQPEKFTKLEGQKNLTEKLLAGQKEALAVLKSELEQMKVQLARKQELEAQAEKLAIRADNIKTLKNLFKGSGFVNYVSTIYLQQLCAAANERFQKLTRQSLSLEIGEDNNLYVRDHLNEGRLRSVKTLSGGQTFQASLCLALALAEQVSSLNKASQNFFFLDEGFGSLDAQSLKIVFEALKSLRQENRIVGIISHVEDMQEEIDVHLRIMRNEERGSYVVPSWE